jgi:hypothetical protein
LGIAVASGLRGGRIVVPENGFISLNIPLTISRLGSFSTRTTHPFLISLLRDVLSVLDIDVHLEMPYRHMTKGEMLQNCADQRTLAKGLGATMSCAHPSAGRFQGGHDPNQHCGYCIPCLIRRAAISSWGDDPTRYTWSNLGASLTPGRGADLRAVRLALDHYAQDPPRLSDLLAAGPLPGNTADRIAYLGVFRRGLAELQAFVEHYA